MCSAHYRNRVSFSQNVQLKTRWLRNYSICIVISSIKHSYFRTLFYMYSFLFLVFRTTAVVMQASAINDESKQIVPEIFMCPTHSYSIEVCYTINITMIFVYYLIRLQIIYKLNNNILDNTIISVSKLIIKYSYITVWKFNQILLLVKVCW